MQMEVYEPKFSFPGRSGNLGASLDSLDLATAELHPPSPSPLSSAVQVEVVPDPEGPAGPDSVDILRTLEWFREALDRVSKEGYITVKELKKAAIKEHKEFAESLFKLFDTDCSKSVSLQELVGGLGRLTVKGKKKKILKWFEEVFAAVSGEDQLLQLDEFKQALHINGFLDNIFQLMDVGQAGKLTVPEVIDAFGKLTCMDKDAKWLAWFEQRFTEVAGTDRQIDFDEFKRALNVTQSTFFAERFFKLFDEDNSGTISLKELMNGLTLLSNGSNVDKLRFLFRVYDVDGNGYIDFNELRTVLYYCMNESSLKFDDEKLDELTQLVTLQLQEVLLDFRALFEDADTDNSGSITFEELRAELEKYPGVVENLTISAANWLKPPPSPRQKKWREYCPNWLKWRYIRNNLPQTIFLIGFVVINFVLFIEAAVRYRSSGPLVSIARGCGQCLNFNPVVAIILMMRRSLTWLRSTPLSSYLPLDHHIELHKLVGYTILMFSIGHFLAHLANFSRIEANNFSNYSMWEYLIGVDTDIGWVGGAAGLTGFILLFILLIMVICSLPCIRRKGYFEVFYWSHNLFFLWYIVLIFHGPNFWAWFLVPGFVYIVERVLRSRFIKLARYGRTYVQKGILLPSKVVHLIIDRPHNFSYQPGDYIFLQVPAVAKYEWHPFTISSCPEQQGVVWLHVRAVGTWTKKLYYFFEHNSTMKKKAKLQKQLSTEYDDRWCTPVLDPENPPPPPASDVRAPPPSDIYTAHMNRQDFLNLYDRARIVNLQMEDEDNVDNPVEVLFDGPYGTPSVHIFQAEHAVLIGAGIGVTPFASILQSIMWRYRNAKQLCPRCNHGWTSAIPTSVMRLKKVDFFWINRHQKSFEWFVNLLSQLEVEQKEQGAFGQFLDMHMYVTSALSKTDIKAIGLQMALDLIHKKEKKDLITGLHTRTQAGRPDWDKVFQQLSKSKHGKVTVFFCGSPALSTVLRNKCIQYGFEFHKENF